MRSTEIELIADVHADIGEGPIWDADSSTLLFVDISPGIIYRHDPESSTTTTISVGQEVSAVIPRQRGGLAVAVRDGIGVLGDADGTLEVIVPIEADNPDNRMNDAKCDPQGRLWAGTMAFNLTEAAAALYRIGRDQRCTRVLSGTTLSNGLGWSLDGSQMYFIDSTTYGLDIFDFDQDLGMPTNRRRLISFTATEGLPDGMTVDADGYLWVAIFGGGVVKRFTPDGKHVGDVRVPVRQVTSCTFGGSDLLDLYITTAAHKMTATQLETEPHAGGLFRCRPGPGGLPAVRYAG